MKSILSLLLLLPLFAFCQEGRIYGTITEENGDPLPFVTVIVYDGDEFVHGTRADEYGKYSLKVAPGKYRVVMKYLTADKVVTDVIALSEKPSRVNMEFTDKDLGGCITPCYPVPYYPHLFERDAPSGLILMGSEIRRLAY